MILKTETYDGMPERHSLEDFRKVVHKGKPLRVAVRLVWSPFYGLREAGRLFGVDSDMILKPDAGAGDAFKLSRRTDAEDGRTVWTLSDDWLPECAGEDDPRATGEAERDPELGGEVTAWLLGEASPGTEYYESEDGRTLAVEEVRLFRESGMSANGGQVARTLRRTRRSRGRLV